jgi:dolichyl-phosphate beta-glucosyltransferase
MRSPLRTSLVVPCYNEANRLDVDRFRTFLHSTDSVHLIFVNDGSSDTTASMLNLMCRGFANRSTILSYPDNKGKAEAVRFGVNHALRQMRTEIVGFWDADLATPFEELDSLLDVFVHRPDIQMVFGARVKLLGRNVVRISGRHYLGRVFATFVSQMLGIPVYDTQCGAKLFRVSQHLRRAFELPFLSRWVFDVEIIARFLQMYSEDRRNLANAIYECPLSTWIDVAGSKVRPKHFFIAFLDVLRIMRQLPKRVKLAESVEVEKALGARSQ